MGLTAREWLILPKEEQMKRGKELSEEECRKLRMEFSEFHITEEEKEKLTEGQKYRFIHPRKLTEEEKERNSKAQFHVMQEFELLPKDITWEEWKSRGCPLNWRK